MPRTHLVLALASCALVLAAVPARPAGKPSKAGKPSAAHSTVNGQALADSGTGFREGHPRIFMAWHAPWGTPGARDTAAWACDDTLAADTLYLTFDPGEDEPALFGADATLLFHAAPGETLGTFWDFTRQGANPYNLRIEFEHPPAGAPSPWPVVGSAAPPRYQKHGDTGRLDLTFFVQASLSGPVAAGNRYFFARIMIRVRKPQLTGCRQPVCVDFDHLQASYREESRWINSGERFTSGNSPGGMVCASFRKRPPSEEPVRFGGRYDLNQAPVDAPAARDTTRR